MGSDLSTDGRAAGASEANAATTHVNSVDRERSTSTGFADGFDWLIGSYTASPEPGPSNLTSISKTASRTAQNGGMRKRETTFDKVSSHRPTHGQR